MKINANTIAAALLQGAKSLAGPSVYGPFIKQLSQYLTRPGRRVTLSPTSSKHTPLLRLFCVDSDRGVDSLNSNEAGALVLALRKKGVERVIFSTGAAEAGIAAFFEAAGNTAPDRTSLRDFARPGIKIEFREAAGRQRAVLTSDVTLIPDPLPVRPQPLPRPEPQPQPQVNPADLPAKELLALGKRLNRHAIHNITPHLRDAITHWLTAAEKTVLARNEKIKQHCVSEEISAAYDDHHKLCGQIGKFRKILGLEGPQITALNSRTYFWSHLRRP